MGPLEVAVVTVQTGEVIEMPDRTSATSQVLTRIILEEKYGLRPTYFGCPHTTSKRIS
ncbi:MAG: hypothetical protein U9P36_07295 [Thermodesulfobacteriota bacterium]|nr:hypothetical protein [Thermodesulfobacteriota bacterium]